MITYRDLGPDDAATLADLHRRSFVETFAHLYRPEDLEAFLAQLSEEGFRGELLDGEHQIRFAEAEGEPVAFVKLGPITLPVEPIRPALVRMGHRPGAAARRRGTLSLGLHREPPGQGLLPALRLRLCRALQVHGRRAGGRG
jgi:hypothetical protein